MTHEEESTMMQTILQPVLEKGFDGLGEMMTAVLNIAMQVERENMLGAQAYERTDARTGYANGFKDRTLKTTVGKLKLQVPQVRGTAEPFRPSVLDQGQRHEKALTLAIAEMYFQGVATRRVSRIFEDLCGLEVSAAQVSRVTEQLDEIMAKWRDRPIGCVKALVLDAMYEKVRIDGSVVSCAVLSAIGIMEDGHRIVLGTSTAISEAEPHWRRFLQSLKTRGMTGVSFIVSDNHQGLKAALAATFPGVAWQRCQCHLQRNAQAYVTKHELKGQVAADIRSIFNAPLREEAQRLLELTVQKYQTTRSKLAAWMEEHLPDGFAVFRLPEHIRGKRRTSNMAENLNRQIRRRTRIAGLFPNETSLPRLVSAILSEISDEWESGKVYLSMEGMPA